MVHPSGAWLAAGAALALVAVAGCGGSASQSITWPQAPTSAPTETRTHTSPTPTQPAIGLLTGRVTGTDGQPLAGVMITAYDQERHQSTSVFTAADGRYRFHQARPVAHRLRARRIGFAESFRELARPEHRGRRCRLHPAANLGHQLSVASDHTSIRCCTGRHAASRATSIARALTASQIGNFEFRDAERRKSGRTSSTA